MKYLIIIIFICYSCELTRDNVYHKLPIEYKTLLHDNDTILYQSGNRANSLFIRVITNANFKEALSGNSCKEPYEFWEFEYLQYYRSDNQSQNYIDYLRDNNINEFGACALGLPDEFNSIQVHYGIRGIYLPTIEFKGIHYQCLDTFDIMIINNIEYKDVLYFKPKQITSKFFEIFFNYKKGLIKYSSDSLIYELKTFNSK